MKIHRMYKMCNYSFFISCIAFLSLLSSSCSTNNRLNTLVSPTEKVKVLLSNDSNGYYLKASKTDFDFIEKINLGVSIKGNDDLFNKLTSVNGPFVKRENVNEMGISNSAEVSWNEYVVNFSGGEKIEIRVFEEGLAFRYKIDTKDTVSLILGEKSSWTIPAKTKVWFFERNNNWKLKSYAGEWVSCAIEDLQNVSKTGNIQGKPLIFEYSNGLYGVLAEASLFNYSGMRFEALSSNTLKANFHESNTGFTVSGQITTPWRVSLIADNLNQLVNQQSIFTALNPSADPELFADRSWIKPGKSVWRWWSSSTGTPKEERLMVDDAQQLGFEYSMIDAGWEKWDNKWQSLAQICDYGKKNNVGIWVWKHSKELQTEADDFKIMQMYMDSLQNAGVRGIKVDFMDGESKNLINFDEAVLRHAAKRKLMVNFHGCQTSTGEVKKYPNEMTREGIRGLELNIHPEGPISASHNAALPFTRFVLGHGDYTPLSFTSLGGTTWAQQLATLILFTSPLQVIAEDPQIILNHPSVKEAVQLIKNVPTVWDQTVVLPGSRIGEIAAIAKRNGNDWYVGVINGGNKKTLDLDISSLNVDPKEAILYYDAKQSIPNPIPKNTKSMHYSKQIVPFLKDTIAIQNQKLKISLEKFGGAVLTFKQP